MHREVLANGAAVADVGGSDALSPAEVAVLARHCRAAALEDLLLWLSGYEVGSSPRPCASEWPILKGTLAFAEVSRRHSNSSKTDDAHTVFINTTPGLALPTCNKR